MLEQSEKCLYLRVAEGKLRIKCNETTPGAVSRTYKDKDNTEKTIWELVYTAVSGKIVNIIQRDHPEYGTSFNLVLKDGEDKYSIQMGDKSNYFSTFVMALPNIDLSKPVKIKPYSIKNDNGYDNQGFVIYQDEKKIENYYKNYDETTKRSTPKNGLEQFDFTSVKKNKKGQYDKDEMAIMRIKVTKFLKEELEKQLPRLKAAETHAVSAETAQHDEADEDLPF